MILGAVAGAHYSHAGGPSEYMCLPAVPQWGRYQNGGQGASYIYGAEYELGSNNPFLSTNARGSALHNQDVPCALCHVTGSTAVLVLPAMTQCPDGWKFEYNGYMMAAHHGHKGRVGPVCVDEAPEILVGGSGNVDGVLFYLVETICGALHCPNYFSGRELACIVCTK